MLDRQHVQRFVGGRRAVVHWSDTADAALERMGGLGCDQLAVLATDGIIGVIHKRSLLAAQKRGTWLGSITVADLMRRGPFWCRESDSEADVLDTMQKLIADMLAVLDRDGAVVGMVSREHLLGAGTDRPVSH